MKDPFTRRAELQFSKAAIEYLQDWRKQPVKPEAKKPQFMTAENQ